MPKRSAKKSLYDILGISKDADAETIRKAHRSAAMKAHPDHGGTTEQMALVTLAKDVLTDAQRRATFDATGAFDETEPNTLDAKAMNHITGFINAVIDSPNMDALTTDLVNLCSQHLAEQIRQIKAKGHELSKPLAKLEKVQKKFKRKAQGPNMIARLLEQRIEGTRNVIKQLEAEIPSYERAIQMIQEYEFTFDAPVPQPHAQAQNLWSAQTASFHYQQAGLAGMFKKGGGI